LADGALEEPRRELILDQLLDRATQGPGSVGRVPAPLRQELSRRRRQPEADLALRQTSLQLGELDVHDPGELLSIQRAEDDDLVHAVQELRSEVVAQDAQDAAAHLLEL